jgi:hypothetical protein
MNHIYAYIRVSSKDQNTDRKEQAILQTRRAKTPQDLFRQGKREGLRKGILFMPGSLNMLFTCCKAQKKNHRSDSS